MIDPDAIISFNWRRDIINSQDTIEDKQNAIKNVTKRRCHQMCSKYRIRYHLFLNWKGVL
ncbi:hypothetical protein [Catenibacterium sp. co_0103]|uniref:hypothetical protein n=1 Tax=Catenibacterium sp. co_0103 TaxID=2478954 RepID=UPI0024793023|nr:hypothetical protein [Catenibacterium sp. co_0103]